jgi:hypothetical protein
MEGRVIRTDAKQNKKITEKEQEEKVSGRNVQGNEITKKE